MQWTPTRHQTLSQTLQWISTHPPTLLQTVQWTPTRHPTLSQTVRWTPTRPQTLSQTLRWTPTRPPTLPLSHHGGGYRALAHTIVEDIRPIAPISPTSHLPLPLVAHRSLSEGPPRGALSPLGEDSVCPL